MKKRVRFLCIIAMTMALLLFAGCAGKSYDMAVSESMPAPAAPAVEMPVEAMYDGMAYDAVYTEEGGFGVSNTADTSAAKADLSATEPADAAVRKIIYNASMGITADDPGKAMQAIIDRANALGGYVASSNTDNDDEGTFYAYLTIKIPYDKLDALVETAEGTGHVNDYYISSDDISRSYYDIQARLENAKAEEKQLLVILEQCETVEDILLVRENLASVRGDIESYQAQINLWDHLVAYTTLDVNIRRTPKAQEAPDGKLLSIWDAGEVWEDIQRGFQNSARFMVNALYAIGIVLAVLIIPCGILFLCIGLPIILHVKKKRRRNAAAGETAPEKPKSRKARREARAQAKAAKAAARTAAKSKKASEPSAETADEPKE